MKFKILYMILFLFTGAFVTVETQSADINGKTSQVPLPGYDSLKVNITPETAHSLIENNLKNEDFIILDVRMPEEFEEGHIRGARNLDYKSSSFIDSLKILDRDKTYLLYCRSGNRSAKSAALMEQMEFRSFYNMLEGIRGWVKNDFNVVRGAEE